MYDTCGLYGIDAVSDKKQLAGAVYIWDVMHKCISSSWSSAAF